MPSQPPKVSQKSIVARVKLDFLLKRAGIAKNLGIWEIKLQKFTNFRQISQRERISLGTKKSQEQHQANRKSNAHRNLIVSFVISIQKATLQNNPITYVKDYSRIIVKFYLVCSKIYNCCLAASARVKTASRVLKFI